MGTYTLNLRGGDDPRGHAWFVGLAAAAGAPLVPVLGIGEPAVTGLDGPGAAAMRWLVCYRPRPVTVVFGEPVVPLLHETAEATLERYTLALRALAKAHAVELAFE
jgi:hypothetical protein